MSRPFALVSCALLVASLIAPPALAQGAGDDPAAQKKSQRGAAADAAPTAEDSRADARAIVGLLGFDARVPELITIYRNTLVSNAVQSFNRPVADVAPIADGIVVPALRAHVDELRDRYAEIWRANLSSYELQDLRARLAASGGRGLQLSGATLDSRLERALQRIAGQEADASDEWGQRVSNAALVENRAYLQAHGFAK